MGQMLIPFSRPGKLDTSLSWAGLRDWEATEYVNQLIWFGVIGAMLDTEVERGFNLVAEGNWP